MANECHAGSTPVGQWPTFTHPGRTGVVAAIDDLISENSNKEKPEICFVHHLDRERLATSLENVIFRIVQESLTNARRYSQSERVLVRLTQREDYIRIQVQDWGIGSNPREVATVTLRLEENSGTCQDVLGDSDHQKCLGTGNPDRRSNCR